MAMTATDRPPLTIAICKGSALLAETRELLGHWQPGEAPTEFAARVLRQGVLGRASAYRTRDIVCRMFAPRYLRPTDEAARQLSNLLKRREDGQWFRDLCLLYACRADETLRAAVSEMLASSYGDGALALDTGSMANWLHEQRAAGRMAKPWSDEVVRKVARGLVRAMTDFGLVQQGGTRIRRINRFRPSMLAVAYLAHDLHGAGVTDQALTHHPDWRCWLQTPSEVRHLLEDAGEHGFFIVQAAAGVTRITWRYRNVGEAMDALARCAL